MSALNRQTSTDLLHVVGQEEKSTSSGDAGRSYDFLAAEDTAFTGSGDTTNHDRFDRARYPLTSPGSALTPTGNMPWLGGSLSGDQSSRGTLGTSLPRSILAAWDRPATYEEELEDRMGVIQVNATTLYESLVSERKKVDALTHQLNARELSHRGAVEKLRDQNDQRFERLKGRARLLVARCEFLRNEKQLAEQRLTQAVESNTRERQGLERKIHSLQEEVERLKNEEKVDRVDDETTRDLLPVLRVTEDGDDLEEVSEEKVKVKQDSTVDCRSNSRSGEHLRLLCDAAVARVAFLERWIAVALSSGHSTTNGQQQQQMDALHSLNGRSNSCPSVAVDSSHGLHLSDAESFHSNEYHLEDFRSVLQVTKPGVSSPIQRSFSEDRTSEQGVIRMKSYPPTSSSVPSVKIFSSTRGVPLTTHGHTAPVLPSTIRTSLHKLFHSGKSSPSEASISPSSASSSSQDKRISVPGRIETPSDEEAPTFDGNFKRNRLRSSKKGKFSASLPTPAAKRHSSLPRSELFRKFHYGGRHEKELRSTDFYLDLTRAAPPRNTEPLTKQERVLGIRLDRASAEGTRPAPDNNNSHRSTTYPSDRLKELPNVRLNSQTDNESTESLPDRVEGFAAEAEEEETKRMKRNRSVHSTFGRLHQRRNGIANIGRIEQKAPTNRSALDGFGKNLKHCLH